MKQETLLSKEKLRSSVLKACKKVAPAWPLENMVAVNPFLGMTDKRFEAVAQEMDVMGMQMTMPTSFYLSKLESGEISLDDVHEVLKSHHQEIEVTKWLRDAQIDAFSDESDRSLILSELAGSTGEKDWKRFMVNRVSSWAGSYFDKGQATWKSYIDKKEMFASWRAEAMIDRTPDFTGLKGFRKQVIELPEESFSAIDQCLSHLPSLNDDELDVYFHGLLRSVNGWASYVAYLDWERKLAGQEEVFLQQFLAVLVSWDVCLSLSLRHDQNRRLFKDRLSQVSRSLSSQQTNKSLAARLILQEAYEKSAQRKLLSKFKQRSASKLKTKRRPLAQAIFCIDVRSEVFRRNLELANPEIETIGFAGFFGFPINHLPVGHNKMETQCPVLLKPGLTVGDSMSNKDHLAHVTNRRRLSRQVAYTWKLFKSGAVSCFSFVSPLGISFLPKLFSDTFGWTRPVPDPKTHGLSKKEQQNLEVDLQKSNDFGISLDEQLALAKGALTAMSLTDNFAKYVLIVGHGSTSVNNPQATGLDCGACGGHAGDVNAKVAATVLNNPEVRRLLSQEGIVIPEDTRFVAGLHDTTTDEVAFFGLQHMLQEASGEIEQIRKAFETAGGLSRNERSSRFSERGAKDIAFRARDWSQVRPEWGLAGCSAFVVAERKHTAALNLEGKSFLHSYDWKKDKEFNVLEQIMTAPMIVTSWINLQYYGSSVDNHMLGAGNKTLHNVTAGLGVIEGSSGDLRQGLAWQSVHDGTDYQHQPLRLNVIIQAPQEAMRKVLVKHPEVRQLFDNNWIKLLTMNDEGQVVSEYTTDLQWSEVSAV